MCFRRDCRKRFCEKCIDANIKLAGSYENACRSKSWRCFLCIETNSKKKCVSSLHRTSPARIFTTTKPRNEVNSNHNDDKRLMKSKTMKSIRTSSFDTTNRKTIQSSAKAALKVWKRRIKVAKSHDSVKQNALDLLLSETA